LLNARREKGENADNGDETSEEGSEKAPEDEEEEEGGGGLTHLSFKRGQALRQLDGN